MKTTRQGRERLRAAAVAVAMAATLAGGGSALAHVERTTLTSGDATRLFDHVCTSPIARGFLLYELYIRAAGFRSLSSPGV
jgi:hypothetical protein